MCDPNKIYKLYEYDFSMSDDYQVLFDGYQPNDYNIITNTIIFDPPIVSNYEFFKYLRKHNLLTTPGTIFSDDGNCCKQGLLDFESYPDSDNDSNKKFTLRNSGFYFKTKYKSTKSDFDQIESLFGPTSYGFLHSWIGIPLNTKLELAQHAINNFENIQKNEICSDAYNIIYDSQHPKGLPLSYFGIIEYCAGIHLKLYRFCLLHQLIYKIRFIYAKNTISKFLLQYVVWHHSSPYIRRLVSKFD